MRVPSMLGLVTFLVVCLSVSSVKAAEAQSQVVRAMCSTDQLWCEMAAAEFQKQTGIRVLQTRKPTGEALAQLRAEASNPKTDIWWGGTGDPFLQAAELGILEPYRPAYLDQLHAWSVRQYTMSSNRVGGFYTSAIGLGWNTELLKKKNLPTPKCWADLISPIYKGEIEISHPASSGTAYTILAGLIQFMGEDKAFEYLKVLHKNVVQYTRSGTAQAPNVAKGEVAVGVSFMFGFESWRYNNYPVETVAPCEGTSYEVGGIALIHGARNAIAARKYYDWLMSAAGQSIGAKAGSFQSPANKTFSTDPRIPSLEGVKLIDYDFKEYGSLAVRQRLLERWQREVASLPR